MWLATLSTVVGVATGMFTLRDQVFPREAGTAGAMSLPAYQRGIGRVCDELNNNDEFRARDEKAIKRRVHHTRSTIAQRNALLDGVRRTASRSAHALASLNALDPPTALAAVRHDIETAWHRHLARLRAYALSLERAGSRGQLLAALDHLSALRPAYASDSDAIRSGLERLGEADCDLEPQIVTPTFTLPALHPKNHSGDVPANGPGTASPTSTATPRPTPRVNHAPAPATGPTGSAPPANQPAIPRLTPPVRLRPLPPANPPQAPADG